MLNFELQTEATGQHQLSLEGRSANPHWVAWLEAGLAQLRIGIVSANVIRSESVNWKANFVLDFRNSRHTPDSVDYVRLVSAEVTPPGQVPALNRSLSLRRPDGSIELRVEAPPAAGVLGRLLHRLAGLALFPSEIHFSPGTRGCRYQLVLRGIAGSVPLRSAHEQLGAALAHV